MLCIHPWFYIEHVLLAEGAIALVLLYCSQLINNYKREQWITQHQDTSKLPVGRTRWILHVSGFLASILVLVRCIDPIPIWGVYSIGLIDLFSHTTTATIYSGVFLALQQLTSSIFSRIRAGDIYCFKRLVYTLCIFILLTGMITACVYIWVTPVLLYSDGINMGLLTLSGLIFVVALGQVIYKLNHLLKIMTNREETLASLRPSKKYSRDTKALHKLTRLWKLSLCIFLLLWGLQAIMLVKIFTTEEYHGVQDRTHFSWEAGFLWLQELILFFLLWLSWRALKKRVVMNPTLKPYTLAFSPTTLQPGESVLPSPSTHVPPTVFHTPHTTRLPFYLSTTPDYPVSASSSVLLL